MPISDNSIEERNSAKESPKNEILESVVTINRMRQLRQEIQLIADRSYQKQIISDKSYAEYQKLAAGKNEEKITLQLLKGMRDFAEIHEMKAEEIQKRIESAKRGKVASDNDEKFLMSHLIVDNELRFSGDFIATENLILQKIKRMEDDKQAYDKIANHKLAKNVGYLKTDKNTKIDIPDEKKFLEMTVPERRKFLEQIKENLSKAEKYAEEAGKEESKEITGKYKGLLDKAYKKRIIGKDTYEKFLDGFKKIDKNEKKYWISEFPNQMKRYEKLWNDIKSTLKGKALERMESMRDEKGYTELFAEFGKISGQEKKRLDNEYGLALGRFENEKIIGKHTVNEFTGWMKNRELKDKYDAVSKLHDGHLGQMERYRKLHDGIRNDLPKKAQVYMASKLDEWGYTEMKSQYDRFMQGEQIPSQDKTESKDDPLSVVTSTAVKRAIVDTNITLKREGNDKRHTFLNRVRRMFGEKQHDKFNATGFQARLREDREKLVDKNKTAETNQSVPPKRLQRLDDSFQSEETTQSAFRFQQKLSQVRAKSGKAQENGRKTMEEVDKTGIEDEMRVLKETKKAHVVNEEGFRQIKTSKGADHIERKAQLEINREKAMKRFFIEDNKQEFQNKEHGGHDDLSLAVRMEGGRTVELDLTEIRALGKYLEEEEKKDMEDKRLDKAA
jgi:hypothetical protein